MEGFIEQLHDARRRQRHTTRSLAAAVGVSHEAISRLERASKGCVGTVRAIAEALGYDLRLFTADGKLLLSEDGQGIGRLLYDYRRNILRKPRKAMKPVSVDMIMTLEHEPDSAPICELMRYATSLGLTLGLTRRVNLH